MLLDDVVPREPGEVEPVADLPLHVGVRRLALVDPETALVPRALARHDLPDRTVVDSLHDLEVRRLMTTLRPRDDPQPLRLRPLRRLDDGAHPRGVDGDRLLHEDVLPRLDRRGEMHRSEAGRGGEDHEVDVARDHLLVGVESGEATLLGHVDLLRLTPLGVEVEVRLRESVLEEVTERGDPNPRRGVEAVCRRARAATAASDDTDLDRVVAPREEGTDPGGREHGGPGDRGARYHGGGL